ncbi:unnamed protein product [Linum trigynum]|uniref:DUF4283 domain-containing protein n=1 Tax=Linum trigynum TaxID=586398 RepID=A0AAV2DV87_9ROSI
MAAPANPPPVNWAQLFGVGKDNRLRYVAPTLDKGDLVIPQAVQDEGAARWRNSLMGQFLAKPPSLFKICRWAQRFWGRDGKVLVTLLGDLLIMFHLPNSDSCNWVFENGPWHCEGNPLFV